MVKIQNINTGKIADISEKEWKGLNKTGASRRYNILGKAGKAAPKEVKQAVDEALKKEGDKEDKPKT